MYRKPEEYQLYKDAMYFHLLRNGCTEEKALFETNKLFKIFNQRRKQNKTLVKRKNIKNLGN